MATSKAIATEAWSQLVHSILSWSPPTDMSMEYYYTLPEDNSNRLDIYKYKLGTKNIEARIRSGMHSQVVQANEYEDEQQQQGIEYIQDRIRSTNDYYAMKANEREYQQQGIENVQDCMRSTNDYYVVLPNEDGNQQGMDHIQTCMRSTNHYGVVQANEQYEDQQQVIEPTQHSTGSTVPAKYEEDHQSINNIREIVRSQGLPRALQQPEDDGGYQQWINFEKLKKMSTLFDDLLEFIEHYNMNGVEKPTLRFQVLEVIKLLHHYGIDTIRAGVEEELEYVNQRKDVIMENNSATHYHKKKALEAMLRICDTETCQTTIYEIIGKAEKDQVFYEW